MSRLMSKYGSYKETIKKNCIIRKYTGGAVEYYNNERNIHRENGPAVKLPNIRQEWWYNGELHRAGGPAVECKDGYKYWYNHGELHREDGPAILHPDGSKEFFIDGRRMMYLPSRDEMLCRDIIK